MVAPVSIHLWRHPPAWRWSVGGGLFILAVALGVTGQWLLAGPAALACLVAAAASLLASAGVFIADYRGDIEVTPQGLVIPGRPPLSARRLRDCDVRPGPGGTGEIRLRLAFPDEELAVSTGQPRPVVEALAAAVRAVAGT